MIVIGDVLLVVTEPSANFALQMELRKAAAVGYLSG